jgi:hypothetical protein
MKHKLGLASSGGVPFPVIPLHSISTPRASSPPPQIDACEVPAYTANEIRTLPGLRGVAVSRIIAGRPYQSCDELLTRKLFRNLGGDQRSGQCQSTLDVE